MRWRRRLKRGARPALFLGAMLAPGCGARADVTVLLEDPINMLGRVTAAGHVAVWLDKLCSDDHLKMRMCRAGEAGAVVSRHPALAGGEDWMAMTPSAHFFAVDRQDEIPELMTPERFAEIEQAYWASHVKGFHNDPGGESYAQLTGASYRRRIRMVRVHTTEAQEAQLMEWLNRQKNLGEYSFIFNNCANLIQKMLNTIFPGAIHRNLLLDAGILTPKQLLASLHRYAMRHKELGWEERLAPQVGGTMARSRQSYGVTENYVKGLWFLLPLNMMAPISLGVVAGVGLCDHRYVTRPRLELERSTLFGARSEVAWGEAGEWMAQP